MATNNPALLGTVMAFSWIPMVLFNPFGGVMADRLNKKNVVTFFQFLTAIAIVLYVILTGHLNVMILSIIMLIVVTILQTFPSASFETAVYSLIPMEELMRANQVTWIMMLGSGVAAPMFAGFIMRSFGLSTVVYISAGFYVISMLLNSLIKMPFTKPEKSTDTVIKMIAKDTKTGFNYIFKENKTLQKATIAMCLMALILGPVLFFIPQVFITTILQMDETRLGFAQGAIAVGGIIGVLVLGKFEKKITIEKTQPLLASGSIVLIITAAVFGLTNSDFVAYLAIIIGLFLVNSLMAMFSMLFFTYLGQHTPEDIVGKVMSFAMTIMFGSYAAVGFLSGRLFELFSGQPELSIVVLPAIALLVSPLVRMKKVEDKNVELEVPSTIN
jgi:MFS family permease